jgi:hypothetical protein
LDKNWQFLDECWHFCSFFDKKWQFSPKITKWMFFFVGTPYIEKRDEIIQLTDRHYSLR